ncbi:hypothetical protein B0H19DRAFT_1258832 [Mycena capillaripes]|nr:hypothetical protein B0H19DRAFT_1258832 [Mycena capillaripes]
MDLLYPPAPSINTTLTPIFVPNPRHILAIESYFGLMGPGISVAFLYNPLDPNSGIAIDERGRLVPVLEGRWREFERAVAEAQVALQNTWGVESCWSRPQNMTCPTDVFYDLGAPAATSENLTRFGLSGHMVYRYRQPDDVQWYARAEDDLLIKVVDFVPAPFLEVERIIRNLTNELLPTLPWDWPDMPIPADVRAMLRSIATMARMKRWWGKGY